MAKFNPVDKDYEREVVISQIALKHFPRSIAIYCFFISYLITKNLDYSLSFAGVIWIFFLFLGRLIPKNIVETNLWLILGFFITPISLWFPIRWVLLVIGAILYTSRNPLADKPLLPFLLIFIFDAIRIFIFK